MTNRLLITHLVLLGPDRAPATVTFGSQMTIVRGPSDTGKSFIADSIDFMLGAKSLRTIPQSSGYSTVFMGLRLPNDRQITLVRAIKGGAFSLYPGMLLELPSDPPQRILAERHDAQSEDNLSNYLLAQLALSGRQLRRNQNNEKDSLSFRDLAHLCVIDENQIQSPTPPPLSGQVVSSTKEKSTLRMLLLNQDDSALSSVAKPAALRATSKAKAEVLNQLLTIAKKKLGPQSDAQALNEQLARLETSISMAGDAIESSTRTRAGLARNLARIQSSAQNVKRRLDELRVLQSRFTLLADQYELDIERLDMVQEAGGLLGYLSPGSCPFCGAEEEHQNDSLGGAHGERPFASVILSERTKTEVLRSDLTLALDDLSNEAQRLEASEAEMEQESSILEGEIRQADQNLRPNQERLADLIATRSEAESALTVHEQVDQFEELLRSAELEAKPVSATKVDPLPLSAANSLSERIRERLVTWGFPNADSVRFDRKDFDIVDDEQLRSAHGKGVRAVLHAAFTLGLADYCFANDLPHPGFVVLDSPLVTYKPPKPGVEEEPDEESKQRLDPSVIGRFYRDLQENVTAQVIVMENTDPPDELAYETVDVEFTASLEGRWGFLPKLNRRHPEQTD